MTRLSAILPALLVPLVLAGCFPRPDYRDLPDAKVIQRTATVVDSVAIIDTAAPSPMEKAAVAAALARAGDSGVRVRVRLPQGAPLPPADQMRARVAALGIDPAIAVVEPGTSPTGTALVFVRVTLTAPDCATLVTPSEELSAWARPSMAFGCATYSNLTHMVTDPADLAAPRSFGGADATTSAAAVGRFYDNKVTPLRDTTSTRGYSSVNGQ